VIDFYELERKYPQFDATKWIPLTVRYGHLPIRFLFKTNLEEIYKLPTKDAESLQTKE
jgi:hypothetical protein